MKKPFRAPAAWAWSAGFDAWTAGHDSTANPYKPAQVREHADWLTGYRSSQAARGYRRERITTDVVELESAIDRSAAS